MWHHARGSSLNLGYPYADVAWTRCELMTDREGTGSGLTSRKDKGVAILVNEPSRVHFTYRRHLENRIRAEYGFAGAPVVLHFRRTG